MRSERPWISAIVPIRNRSGVRLENCLRSLRWQTIPKERVQIVVSDFGSDPEHQESVKSLAEAYDVQVKSTATAEVWNRSRALNLGIQAASAPWVLCTDVDMIFAPNFIESILAVHDDTSRDAMIHCRCHDLPETVEQRRWDRHHFPELLEKATVRQARGTGACQSARRSFFFRARGYDEKFTFWGAEDIDMTARSRRAGLEVVWVSESTRMLHQWHPKEHRKRWNNYRLNRWRYRLTKWQVTKNRGGWGELP